MFCVRRLAFPFASHRETAAAAAAVVRYSLQRVSMVVFCDHVTMSCMYKYRALLQYASYKGTRACKEGPVLDAILVIIWARPCLFFREAGGRLGTRGMLINRYL